MALGSDFSNININELIVDLIEQMRFSKLPECLEIKNYISVNGVKCYGSIKPYAIKIDKNGYPHFFNLRRRCLGLGIGKIFFSMREGVLK